jgi:twitching motility two-component system response regulator PilG
MFNLIQLLSKYSCSGSSGYLNIQSNSISWKVYLQEGKLKYVDCSLRSLAQLNYYLHHQGWKTAVKALKNIPQSELKPTIDSTEDSSELSNNIYGRAILWLQAEKHLDNSQVLKLIEDITQDSLEACLWMSEAESFWYQEETIPAWLQTSTENSLSLNLADVVNFLQQRLRGWQSCSSSISSAHQRPYFLDYRDIKKCPSSGILSHKMLMELAQIMRRGLSFRQLSVYLNQDELHVAQILSPYIENKIIYLRNPQPPLDCLPIIPRPIRVEEKKVVQEIQPVKSRKIVCIDDSPTILSEIKRFLQNLPLQITAIDDPVQASSLIFRLEPDLILLDITMPRINGYTLCTLLRSSKVFNKTPIIMVTGNTGMIDKARAKIAGATDYFTKPFTQEGLMRIIEKYLGQIQSISV